MFASPSGTVSVMAGTALFSCEICHAERSRHMDAMRQRRARSFIIRFPGAKAPRSGRRTGAARGTARKCFLGKRYGTRSGDVKVDGGNRRKALR